MEHARTPRQERLAHAAGAERISEPGFPEECDPDEDLAQPPSFCNATSTAERGREDYCVYVFVVCAWFC